MEQPTPKQRIELARGKNIPIDYFLFTCLEHERTKRAQQQGEEASQQGRWPIMLNATVGHAPAEFEALDLRGLLGRMCLWYAAQYPEMVEEVPLDYEMLNQVVDPFMKFVLDLSDLVLLKTEAALPAHNQDTDVSRTVWDIIAAVLKEEFPGYHAYFVRFLKWAFADIQPEEIEPGSRPPVGKNMPNFRAMRTPQQSHGGGQREHRGDHQRGGGGGQQRDQHQRGDRDNRGNRPQQGQGQGGGGRGPQQHQRNNRPQHSGGGGGGGHNQQADAETERLALASVDEAITKITSGESEEVFLKPMNSFYRRIQHQYAVDKGFESCSVGDGNDRGVKVSKPQK